MSVQGEEGTPSEPAKGLVWVSILEHWNQIGFQDEFVNIVAVPRDTLAKHPWSLGGGGASELKERLESASATTLGELATDIGFSSFPGMDDVFVMPDDAMRRLGVPERYIRPLCPGDSIRDWASHSENWAITPYDDAFNAVPEVSLGRAQAHFWRYRTTIRSMIGFGGKTRGQSSEPHWTWYRWIPSRLRIPLSLVFAEVATHNHFVLDRGGKAFKQTAPVIKMPPGATEDEHLSLLGFMNSSAAAFWMKQVCHPKGSATRDTMRPENNRYAFASTALRAYPLPPRWRDHALLKLAKRMDEVAGARENIEPERILDALTGSY